MRRSSRLAPLLVILAAFCSGSTLPAQQSVVVRGRIVRADDHTVPLSRARISLDGKAPVERIFTDGQGRFEVAVPATGATLTVTKPGFVTTTLPLSAPGLTEPLEIALPRGAAVTGRVIDPSGKVVTMSGVRVRPLDQPRPADPAQVPVSAVTDDRGEFRVGGLAPGRYEVSASFVYNPKEQFESDITPSALLVMGLPRPTPEPVAVTLDAGQEVFVALNHKEPASIEYMGVGTVTGAVIDDFGEPVQGLRVRLWEVSIAGGRRVLKPTDSSHVTDDRGHYRSYNVMSGRYLVAVDDPDGVVSEPSLTADTPVFYPRTVRPSEAFEIDMGPQQETTSINVLFTARRQARVRGFVTNAAGWPSRANVTLVAASYAGEPSMPTRSVVSDASTGAFQFENVAPGEYVVRARDAQITEGIRVQRAVIFPDTLPPSLPRSTASEFGAAKFSTRGDDPPPITVITAPTSSIVGRVAFERIQAGPDLKEVTVLAVPDDPDLALGVMQASARIVSPDSNGLSFEVGGLVGSVRIVVKAPAPWWLKSVQTPGLRDPDDVFDPAAVSGGQGELTLLLANTAAVVSGRVLKGRSEADTMVLLFPTGQRRWLNMTPYIKTSQPGTDGRYTLAGISPGEYFITAVALDGRQRAGEWWTDREALLMLAPASRRITVSEGQPITVDLALVPAA